MKLEADINGTSIPVDIDSDGGVFTLPSGGGSYSLESMSDGRYLLRIGERLLRIDGVKTNGSSIEFSINGQFVTANVHDEHALMLRSMGFKTASDHVQGQLKAPMPGKIVAVSVTVGDMVDHGQPVVILEAMKMENELKAPVGGRINKVSAVVGSSVEKNELLIEIEPIG
jgi:biotin carboxyl carrier protein